MNPKRKRKLILILCAIAVLSIGASLVLYALKQNINLFYTPTELSTAQLTKDQTIRVGGYVKKGTVKYDASGEQVQFVVTDRTQEIAIQFRGVLPNLFKEGQTVVVTGYLSDPKHFDATEVLAKHDEKYIPKSLEAQLKKGEVHGA